MQGAERGNESAQPPPPSTGQRDRQSAPRMPASFRAPRPGPPRLRPSPAPPVPASWHVRSAPSGSESAGDPLLTYWPLGGRLPSSRPSLPAPPLPRLPGLAWRPSPNRSDRSLCGNAGARGRSQRSLGDWEPGPGGRLDTPLNPPRLLLTLSREAERRCPKEEDQDTGPGL